MAALGVLHVYAMELCNLVTYGTHRASLSALHFWRVDQVTKIEPDVRHSSQNPIESEPKPPYPRQSQPFPGRESEMRPRPDFGEQSYQGSGRLVGKKALITGGDSGIGRAVAVAFAREGADVLISYLSEEDDAQETRARRQGERANVHCGAR